MTDMTILDQAKVPPSPIPEVPDRPCFRVLEAWLEHNGTKYRPGVWHFGTDKDGNLTQQWVCSPLHIDAVTFDAGGNNFGRLLRFSNSIGRWREWAMPMSMLAGMGNEVRHELLDMGLEIDASMKARNLLATYLQDRLPKRRVRCVAQSGWCSGAFVLPSGSIGEGAGDIILQIGERANDDYTLAGTLDGWRKGVAAMAAGNAILTLAVSSSFCGPLLKLCNAESGGVHFVDVSSSGKTTALEAACATWGGDTYRRSWRTTANGLEGAAAQFNDGFLALDEINECDPKAVGEIVYALGNGRGKQRASRTGAARGVAQWRCFVISSGERSIGTHMAEAGHRAKAGQMVRLLDIPTARTHGAWDTLHGYPSGAEFSNAIRLAAKTHYGYAGREYLERLTRDPRDFRALLAQIEVLPGFAAEDGQEKRAAARCALVGLAGELATEYGITGWAEGEAIRAAAEGFRLWLASRPKGNSEHHQVLGQVLAFIERHGDSRFQDARWGDDAPIIRDRAGWWEDADGARVYLFTAGGMREALKGLEFAKALDVLVTAGALPPPGANGEHSKFRRFRGVGARVYQINADALSGVAHGH